ncbi:MAG: hypothetical protein Q7T03_03125 [Deltaproteobacteria bacterium]|nr:hypothetical protein [Deltaproteobacteria bacterium]
MEATRVGETWREHCCREQEKIKDKGWGSNPGSCCVEKDKNKGTKEKDGDKGSKDPKGKEKSFYIAPDAEKKRIRLADQKEPPCGNIYPDGSHGNPKELKEPKQPREPKEPKGKKHGNILPMSLNGVFKYAEISLQKIFKTG